MVGVVVINSPLIARFKITCSHSVTQFKVVTKVIVIKVNKSK